MGPLDTGLSQAFGQSSDPASRDGTYEMMYGQHVHLHGVQGLFSGTDSPAVFGLFF